MAKDITDAATAMEIATVLVPQRAESQPFFPEAARALLAGVIEALLHLAPERWRFRDVVLALRSEKRLRGVLNACKHTEHLAELYMKAADTHRDIAATLENTIRRLAFIAAAWDHAARFLSLQDWIQSESIIVLGSNPTLESTMQQLNSALIHRATQIILSQPEASLNRNRAASTSGSSGCPVASSARQREAS